MFLAFLLVKSSKTSPKSREMLRSVLSTGLLLTVYRAVLSVAAPRGRENCEPSNTNFLEVRERKSIVKEFQTVKLTSQS